MHTKRITNWSRVVTGATLSIGCLLAAQTANAEPSRGLYAISHIDDAPNDELSAAPRTLPPPRRNSTHASLRLRGVAPGEDHDSSGSESKTDDGSALSWSVPRVAYADSAFGSRANTLGAAGFGEARGAEQGPPQLGGGVRIWGAPIDRLTLVLDGQRRDNNGKFAPNASAQLRILGAESDGWALSALGRYKTEGFANLEGELEAGILASYGRNGLHLDANAVAGGDFDGGESDGEFLARGGYDVLPFLRLGAEGRARYRLSGKNELPGGRDWDAILGGQLFAFADHYFGAVTAGPSTVGISQKIGWAAIASAGGVAF